MEKPNETKSEKTKGAALSPNMVFHFQHAGAPSEYQGMRHIWGCAPLRPWRAAPPLGRPGPRPVWPAAARACCAGA
ncbi:MAG: hypothetical protein ACK40S_13945, partial [Burkholderiaceae bacterium]